MAGRTACSGEPQVRCHKEKMTYMSTEQPKEQPVPAGKPEANAKANETNTTAVAATTAETATTSQSTIDPEIIRRAQEAAAKKPKLSEKAMQFFSDIEKTAKEESQYISFEDKEEKILYIDPDKGRKEPNTFDPKKTNVIWKAVELTTDEQQKNPQEKEWRNSMSTASMITEYLKQGLFTLKIKRMGTGAQTKYIVTPA